MERFDDDAQLESSPLPPPPEPKDDRKVPPAAGKTGKKGQQEAQTSEKPTDDLALKKPMITEDMLRRIAAERQWNLERSEDARYSVDRLTR